MSGENHISNANNLNEIAELIKDIDQYPIVFKRVTKTKRLDSNIVHVMLDMPFPFSGRDYVIKYSSEKTENIKENITEPEKNEHIVEKSNEDIDQTDNTDQDTNSNEIDEPDRLSDQSLSEPELVDQNNVEELINLLQNEAKVI